MASETSICNQALGWLGANLITSLDDSSIEAQLCKANYAMLRDTVLEEGRWTFARRDYIWGEMGAGDSRQPSASWRWEYQYPIPFDILTVQRVFRGPQGQVVDWERMERFIYTDAPTIYVSAIVRIEDPDLFGKTFTQALAYRIAAELAIPLTQNEDIMQLYEQKYRLRLDDALATDGMQGRNEKLRAGSIVGVRTNFGWVPGRSV